VARLIEPFISLSHCCVESKKTESLRETLLGDHADNLSKAGWSLGWISAVDSEGRTIWIVDAYRGGGKRFVVRANEVLVAFIELESAIRATT
jgi:hypothetical protein